MPLSGLRARLTKARLPYRLKVVPMLFGSVMVKHVVCLVYGATICLWILVKIWSCAVEKSHTIKIQRVKHGRPTRPLCKHAIVLPVEALSCCCFLDINMPSSRLSDKNKRPVNTYRPLIFMQVRHHIHLETAVCLLGVPCHLCHHMAPNWMQITPNNMMTMPMVSVALMLSPANT